MSVGRLRSRLRGLDRGRSVAEVEPHPAASGRSTSKYHSRIGISWVSDWYTSAAVISLAEVMCADVAQLADGLGVGVEPVREVAILDEPLDEVLQGAGAGRLVDPAHEHVPDDVLQHLAGPDQGHLRVFDRRSWIAFVLPPATPGTARRAGSAVDQVLEGGVHGCSRRSQLRGDLPRALIGVIDQARPTCARTDQRPNRLMIGMPCMERSSSLGPSNVTAPPTPPSSSMQSVGRPCRPARPA